MRRWHRTVLGTVLGRVTVAVLLAASISACGDDGATPEPTGSAPVTTGAVTLRVGDRPFQLVIPASYESTTAMPLVVGLHGYSSSPAQLEDYFGLADQAERHGFLLALPEGLIDRRGNHFWNASQACCDFERSGTDDSGYLSEVIETVKRSYAVDAGKVYLIGHSNGGFMALRMACDHADQITAVASLAGAAGTNGAAGAGDGCAPTRPVSVLQLHGTADSTIVYGGGTINGAAYPGAEETVARWRVLNGCSETAATDRAAQDLDDAVAGAETTSTAYVDGCREASRVELWRMQGSGHVPAPSEAFTVAVLEFFYAAA